MKNISVEEAKRIVKEGYEATHGERLAMQRERLHTLVDYARENSPYLRELYKDLPENYTLEDIPVLDKADGLAHYNDWVTDRELDIDRVRKYLARDPDSSLLMGKYTALQTSGSTGEPLPMVRDKHRNTIHMQLLEQRLMSPVPEGFFDHSKHKMAFIVHISNSASSYGSYLKTKALRPGFEDNIMAVSILDSSQQMVDKLNSFQPEIIIAYPPSLVMLAEEQKKGNLKLSLGLIISSAELLTEESYDRIHDVFGCPVLNNYCMTEGGEIAMTHGCPHLHINEDWIIVEPVDEQRRPLPPGSDYSSGILVTDLTNFVQPIIRYYVGDSIRILDRSFDCCGLPVMQIQGRVWENFTIGGKSFTSKGLEVKAKFCNGLCGYQFVQTSDNDLQVRGIVAAGYDSAEVLGELAKTVSSYFEQAGCEGVTVTPCAEPMIHNEKGGKTPLYKRI